MNYTDLAIRVATADTETAAAVMSMAADESGIYIDDISDIGEAAAVLRMDYIDSGLLDRHKGVSVIHAYFPETADVKSAAEFVTHRLSASRIAFELLTEQLKSEDWANAWKAYYNPVKTDGRITVVPSWQEYAPSGDELVLRMDPESAFGSGTHESTFLCLCLLDKLVKSGCTLLDVGCGSGILAIAALLLGADSATACDIDEVSVLTARRNCVKNAVDDRCTVLRSDLFASVSGKYDIITANIVADVIIKMAGDITKHLNPGGVFVCSGIIEERAAQVSDALTAAGLNVLETRCLRGWVALRCGVIS